MFDDTERDRNDGRHEANYEVVFRVVDVSPPEVNPAAEVTNSDPVAAGTGLVSDGPNDLVDSAGAEPIGSRYS